MKKYISLVFCCLLIPLQADAGNNSRSSGKKSDIVVMTQNQYFGADFSPIVEADSPQAYNAAVLAALQSVIGNNLPERATALAETIARHMPHLVGLQEVFEFGCIPYGETVPEACFLFSAAFNDHLTATLDSLADLGADYYVAGVVRNLDISPATFSPYGLLGLPVYLDNDAIPDMFVTVLDRDVILARSDIEANPVAFPCAKPSMDGCNFDFVAEASLQGIPIDVERGFLGVDAVVRGKPYRFVNTHLEVRFLSEDPLAPLVQAAQASQMLGTMSLFPPVAEGARQIVVGDINSSPLDEPFFLPMPPFPVSQGLPPYQQILQGKSVYGEQISAPFFDAWELQRGGSPGFTCCELPDLSNAVSMHDQRIDVIFSIPKPAGVKVRVLNTKSRAKTASGLWPSDHATVVARLKFRRDHRSDDDSDDRSDQNSDDGSDDRSDNGSDGHRRSGRLGSGG